MKPDQRQALAQALEYVAAVLERNPSPVIGINVVATGDGCGGNVTGLAVNVVGGRGDTTGLSFSVSSGDRNPADRALLEELRQAVVELHAGPAPRTWIEGILKRAAALGNSAIDSAVRSASTVLVTAYSIGA